jgi:hypothetical protein
MGSGNHLFEGYETEAWGPHKFHVEDEKRRKEQTVRL